MSPAVWKVRHAGSPKFKGGLTAEQVLDGVRDELWAPDDEVMGPGEAVWQPLERHPVFAAALADWEPAPPPHHPDETRLDMNPLIDVALVLLIFFILTTTYESIRKIMELPHATQSKELDTQANSAQKIPLRDRALIVKITKEGDRIVTRIDDETADPAKLEETIKKRMKDTGKVEMFLDAVSVPWGPVVAVMDAAKGAGIQKVLLRGKKPEPAGEPPGG